MNLSWLLPAGEEGGPEMFPATRTILQASIGSLLYYLLFINLIILLRNGLVYS